MGRVVIQYWSGVPRAVVVTFFRTGGGPGAYQVTTGLDVYAYYRGSSDEEIAATLAACLQRARPDE